MLKIVATLYSGHALITTLEIILERNKSNLASFFWHEDVKSLLTMLCKHT